MAEPGARTAKDLMIDVFAYPHIPYWFTVRQAAAILRHSLLNEERGLTPPVVLVFDEKYNLVGTLTLGSLLQGMRPLFEESEDGAGAPVSSGAWSARQVGELVTPTKTFVEPETPLTETARHFTESGLSLLPVLEDRRKLVGIVRARELFREFARLL